MNIVIKNQNYKITDSLNIEVIKTLSGEFSLEEVLSQMINLVYNRVIIDITAIRNYYDINSVIAFLRGFDPEKTIVLLNDSEVINGNNFLSKLIDNGYYNFTRNAAGINYLVTNPNSRQDVEQYTRVQTESNYSTENNYSINNFGMSNNYNQNSVSGSEPSKFEKSNIDQKIIGIQNLSEHAGSTTLAYMIIKQLKYFYKTKGIEMNKQDFIYFRDSDLVSCTSIDDLKIRLREFKNVDAIIIDLNDFDASEFCDDILYLVDPGTLKLNRLLKKDSNAPEKTKNGKIILNRSAIKPEEIPNFEYETKFRVFFNITNFDDRKDRIQLIDTLLYNLGFKKAKPDNGGLFGAIFK